MEPTEIAQSVWCLASGLDDGGIVVRFSVQVSNFSLLKSICTTLVPIQPPIQCVPRADSPGVNWPGR